MPRVTLAGPSFRADQNPQTGAGSNVRPTLNQLLVKGLKPNGRDSEERQALRQILFQWTWDALATTA